MTEAERNISTADANAAEGADLLSRLLVATGGSEPSLAALRFALHFAHHGPSRIEALMVEEVYRPPGARYAHGEALAQLTKQAERLAASAWNTAEARIKKIAEERGIPIEVRRETGRVGDVVIGASDHATMLLLGRRGCGPDERGHLGSNAGHVVRSVEKPVLLVPQVFRAPHRVLVAYGGKDMGALALGMGMVVATRLKLPLSVLIAERDPRRRESIRENALRHQPGLRESATFEFDDGEPGGAIIKRATPECLVVMGAYGHHSRLYRLVLGSTTEHVIHACGAPLLLSRK